MKSFSRSRLGFGLVLLFCIGLIFMQNRKSSAPALTIADLVAKMVSIPAGKFVMESPDDDEDQSPAQYMGPQTTVTISKPFWMSKYEVTQGQYEELMENNPSWFKRAGMNAPVEQVSWHDAVEFCQSLTERERAAGRLAPGHEYRLPTEAQWEYACRAGTTTRFSYGDDPENSGLRKYACYGDWYGDNSEGIPHPVGEKQPNGWGLYNMHGNVMEWCLDWVGTYPGGEQVDPVGPVGPNSGSSRVIRGGSCFSNARNCRPASRSWNFPSGVSGFIGFRPVLVSVDYPKSPSE